MADRMGLRFVWLSLLVLVLDQVTKAIATANLSLHEPVPLLPFLNWTLAHNEGVAFSLFNDGPAWKRYGLAGFALLVAAGFTAWMVRLPSTARWSAAAIAMIVGGAIGNVIDRLRHGYVVDFVDLHAAGWHWPAFNVADSAICVGAVILVLAGFREEGKER